MPEIPGAERARVSAPRPPGGGDRRWALAAAAGLVVLLLALLLWPVGLLTGGDDDEPAADAADSGSQNAASNGQGASQRTPAGIAIVVEQDGKRQLLIQAARLAPSSEREAYEVWLYNSQGSARSLGGQVTDERGNLQAIGDLPADFADYDFIDVSREPIDQKPAHAGDSVLRGPVPRLREPQGQNAQGNQPVVLGQTVLSPPSP